MNLKEGSTIKGKRGKVITVQKKLAEGGFGSVYLGKCEDNTPCVIKMANIWDHTGSVSGHKEIIEKKLSIERKILNRVGKHPYIPTLLDYKEDISPPFLVTSYIPGKTFYERMYQEKNKFNPLTEEQAKAYILKLLDITEYLHNQSKPVIHRDIKPANLITHGNDLYLIDFGSSVAEWDGLDTTGKTRIFTVGYGAPEQEKGRDAVDIRTDVYGIGATLFFLLTGRDLRYSDDCYYAPYELRPPSVFNASVSKKMSDIVLKATEIFPEDRFQSVTEMKNALLGKKDVNAMKTTLQLGGVGYTVDLKLGQHMLIGRKKGYLKAKKDKDIHISSKYVSDIHARLERDRFGYWVKDMYSLNGTAVYLHGEGIWKKLERGQKWMLYNGDKISLGYDKKKGPCMELLFRDPK